MNWSFGTLLSVAPALTGCGAAGSHGSGRESPTPSSTPTIEARLVSGRWDGLRSNGPVREVAISADGRVVAFTTSATDLFGPAEPNRDYDSAVFARDLDTDVRTKIADDARSVSIYAHDRWIAFRAPPYLTRK